MLNEASRSENGIVVRQSITGIRSKASISYRHLYQDSLLRSHRLKLIAGFGKNPIVLLYVNNHLDSIKWFWAIVAAGAVPCPLPAFSKDPEKRRAHFQALQKLLNSPIIITTEALLPEFDDGLQNTLCVHVAERIEVTEPPIPGHVPGLHKKSHELAVLMLTSGSTGEAKAVALTHGNILSAVDGKSRTLSTTSTDIFLGWTGLDHVANLTEIHLHAMRVSATQIQVHESMVVNEPLEYLQLLSDYKISCTFAPNFILTSMVDALEKHFIQLEGAGAEDQPTAQAIMSGSIFGVCSDPDARNFPGNRSRFDFSNLRNLVSGGEPNVVATCMKLTCAMFYFGAPGTFIRPALGLTESCAGAIYNMRCPYYDLENDLKYCSLGLPTEAIGVRITRDEHGFNKADIGELGYVLLSGPAMFEKYYNNLPKTIESFTHSGW
jgi:acyl-CoA synthetase (AMP-forming)/AMP-acid ligase II